MELNQLRYFVDTCASGSISQAAENLHISQQGLSSSIRRLETELGYDLFYRKASGIVLTAAGEALRDEARSILGRIDSLYDTCARASGKNMTVSVACTLNLIARLPNQLQQILLGKNADCEVRLTESWSSECETMVSEGEAAFGIVSGASDEEKFDVYTLDILQRCFIVNRKSPLAEQEEIELCQLDNVPLVVSPPKCRPGQALRQMFQSAGVKLNVFYNHNRPALAIELVSSNPDVAAQVFLDDIYTNDLESVKPLRLKNDPFLFPICLISKKGRQQGVQERLFRHMVMDCFKTYDSSHERSVWAGACAQLSSRIPE